MVRVRIASVSDVCVRLTDIYIMRHVAKVAKKTVEFLAFLPFPIAEAIV